MTVELVGSILATLWLVICATVDQRFRRVSNWLTLPVIILALVYRLVLGLSGDTTLQFIVIIVPMFLAWQKGLLGGADFKILFALALLGPGLVIAAWSGVALFVLGRIVLRRVRVVRFAGAPGFAFGVALLTSYQVLSTILFRIGTS